VSCINIAHRGASRDAPENTLEAFELAVEQGAHMIETDLHLTTDGQIALYHDDDVDGTPVAHLSLAELRERLPDAPTLQELLDTFGGRIALNLELKRPNAAAYPGLEALALREVRSRELLEHTLFSCFFDAVLATLRGLSSDARIGLLVSPRAPVAIEERADRIAAEAIHPERGLVTREMVESAHHRGFQVNVYTVDDPDEQRSLVALGVDGIITNVPGQLREILSSS